MASKATRLSKAKCIVRKEDIKTVHDKGYGLAYIIGVIHANLPEGLDRCSNDHRLVVSQGNLQEGYLLLLPWGILQAARLLPCEHQENC
jgi:hypothetical protein